MDWDDLRYFLALARYRTLAGAAKHLSVTQSTVSRRLSALQEGMGVRLLTRTVDGYVLTSAGESIRGHVERVETEALHVEQSIHGYDARLEGPVRIAASPFITNQFLLPSLSALHERHPGIVIELLGDHPGEPLMTRDADIALRLSKFEHQELVVRKLGLIPFGLYTCVAYLGRHGAPSFSDGCAGHYLIAQLENRDETPQATWLATHAYGAEVVIRTNNYEAQHSAVLCGSGMALLPRFYAEREHVLHEIGIEVPINPAELWLGTHHSSRLMQRVRLVLDCIAASVRSKLRVDVVEAPVKADI